MPFAYRIEDVLGVLQFAEDEARAGSHVAVMLSYEAAPAFDSALVTHEPSEFPLAWAAVIEDVSGAAASAGGLVAVVTAGSHAAGGQEAPVH